MNYATGCAFNMHEMFMNFPYKKLKLTCEDCEKINNDPHKSKLVEKIFREHMKIVIEDIIDNNVQFVLPTGKKKAWIHVKRFKDEKFTAGRRNRKWLDVDFLKSFFSGYQLVFNMVGLRELREKPIYISKRLKQKLTDYTNQGKQYC